MGDPDDYRRMLEAFDERNAHAIRHEETMSRLVERITALTVQVGILRQDLSRRPTEREVEHKRRGVLVGVLLFALTLAFVIDAHTETCGPGARAERSLDALASGVRDPDAIVRAGRPKESPVCDISVPFHAHSGQHFPNRNIDVGWVLYIALIGGAIVYARGPRTGAADKPVSMYGRRLEDEPLTLEEETPTQET